MRSLGSMNLNLFFMYVLVFYHIMASAASWESKCNCPMPHCCCFLFILLCCVSSRGSKLVYCSKRGWICLVVVLVDNPLSLPFMPPCVVLIMAQHHDISIVGVVPWYAYNGYNPHNTISWVLYTKTHVSEVWYMKANTALLGLFDLVQQQKIRCEHPFDGYVGSSPPRSDGLTLKTRILEGVFTQIHFE